MINVQERSKLKDNKTCQNNNHPTNLGYQSSEQTDIKTHEQVSRQEDLST